MCCIPRYPSDLDCPPPSPLQTPREVCTAVPEPGRYRPSQFVTTALQQRLVRFTWDETDADRQAVVRRAAAAGDVDDADIRAYLADSGDEEQSGGSVEAEGGEFCW